MIDGSLQAPPEPDKPGASIQWYGGIGSDSSDFPGETLVIAVLQSPEGSPLLLIWHSPPGNSHGIVIDWSLQAPPEPEKQGVVINWSLQAPPEPEKQGVVINWSLQAPPEPDKPGFTVAWLPGGVGAGANELALDDTAGGNTSALQLEFQVQ